VPVPAASRPNLRGSEALSSSAPTPLCALPRLLFFLFLWIAASAGGARAQTAAPFPSNLRTRTLAVGGGDTLQIDSLSFAAGSLLVEGVDTSAYEELAAQGAIRWKARPGRDSVRVQYRVLPILFAGMRMNKSPRLIDSVVGYGTYRGAVGTGLDAGTDALFGGGPGLDYNGSYGRSIALGNNQDVVLASAFNLQASGYILDSIRLEAALSDNTIPLQPDGNTQRLQEFDQIFIRLSKRPYSLQAGDYNLDDPPGYFLNYFKRVQGLYFQTEHARPRTASVWRSGLSASVAKGQFARNIFQGGEGNQGPYRLRGTNGEVFFIVLAATERVFVDDVLMERGEDRDYVIDYNTAEIRFMPRRLISKDSRIQVEFEYQDRNYLNSLIYGYGEWQRGSKLRVRLNAYSQQDSRNQSFLQNLDAPRRQFLGTLGDSVQNAFFPVVTLDTFAANKLLYKIVDTVVDGRLYDSVFVYSTSPDSARYNLQFSFVGAGRGDYVLSTRPANGRTYDWVAPAADGARRGDYAPAQFIVTPKRQQVFTLGADYAIDSAKTLSAEAAAGVYDPNLFSSLNDAGHGAGAGRVRYAEERALSPRDSAGRMRWALRNAASYEWVQDRFYGVAPYRNVEFFRDWNVPPAQTPGTAKPTEHLAEGSTAISAPWGGTAAYTYTRYDRDGPYLGQRHIGSIKLERPRVRAGATLNDLGAVDTARQSRFRRPAAYAEWRFAQTGGWVVGGSSFLEDNAIRTRGEVGATLLPEAFSFDVTTAYLRGAGARGQDRYNLSYTRRRDRLPRAERFLLQSFSDNYSLEAVVARWPGQRIGLTGTYRKLHVVDTTFNNQRPEETVLGRIEHSATAGRGAFTTATVYDFGSGQEQRRVFTYVEVPAGQGQFFWNDYNGNGVQEANEFEVALYPDQRRFIRIFTPTNEFVRAAYASLNSSVSFEPSLLSGTDRGARKALARVSDQASLQVSNRVLSSPGLDAYNPLVSALEDARVLALSRSIANTLFFNRSSAVWGAEWAYTYTSNKSLLTYGVEGGSNETHAVRLRWNPARALGIVLAARTGFRGFSSPLEDGRSYRFTVRAAEPSITWIHRQSLRLTVNGRAEDRANRPEWGGQRAQSLGGGADVRWSQPAAGVVQARAQLARILFSGGSPTTSVAFQLLDALQPGTNLLWYAAWDRRVGRGIEVSVEYEGRQPGVGRSIHTGRMTVRAVL